MTDSGKLITVIGAAIAGVSLSWWYFSKKSKNDQPVERIVVEHPIGEQVSDFYDIKRELGRFEFYNLVFNFLRPSSLFEISPCFFPSIIGVNTALYMKYKTKGVGWNTH